MKDDKGIKPIGFAALKAAGRGAEVVEIARRGGRMAHAAGTAHEFTSEEARSAGRLGGKAMHAKRRAQQGAGK
jgi:hypothetical protein